MPSDNQPIHRIQLSSISAAIFRNENADGRAYYKTQFNRSYKDGDEWKSTKSFGRDDLLNLAKVADLVHTWIHENQKANAPDQPTSPSPT